VTITQKAGRLSLYLPTNVTDERHTDTMPTATARIAQKLDGPFTIGPREVHCAVRVGHISYGSVELCVDGLDLFPLHDSAPTFYTLDEVLRHRDVRAVTFRGPWSVEE
jgi:hypothetical protein